MDALPEEERLLPAQSDSPALEDETVEAKDEVKATAKKALYAWLCYAFASEGFSTVSQGLFLPITLEQYARDNGRRGPDHIDLCIDDTSDSPIGAASCDTQLAGRWIDTASFSLYTFSAAVALQALVVITLGAAADDARVRKRLLAVTATLGSLACVLFLFLPSSSPLWPISSLFAISANVNFGLSLVALNAYLPIIAKALAETADSSAVARTTARISARGIAIGYSSGCFLLVLTLIPVLVTEGATWGMRLAIAASGVWWFSAGAVSIISMPTTIGHEKEMIDEQRTGALDGWRGLWRMLREARRLPQTFAFLFAWLFLSDGFTTIMNVAILFGKTEIHMSAPGLILVGLLAPLGGIAGAILWPRLAHRFGLSNGSTLIVIVALISLVPLYGCIGFVSSVIGLRTVWEMWALALYFGFCYGGFQSYARTVYANFIPPRQEASFFALYSITDKSASFLGPLVVGLIVDATGSARPSFFFLFLILALPILLLSRLDHENGHDDAQLYSSSSNTEAL